MVLDNICKLEFIFHSVYYSQTPFKIINSTLKKEMKENKYIAPGNTFVTEHQIHLLPVFIGHNCARFE